MKDKSENKTINPLRRQEKLKKTSKIKDKTRKYSSLRLSLLKDKKITLNASAIWSQSFTKYTKILPQL